MASTSGLTLIQPKDLDPYKATTYGLGEIISKALDKGYRDLATSFLLVVSEDSIYLKKDLKGTSKPIYCDFIKWSKENKKSNLVKALKGLPKKGVIIDATAGLGRDALVLSSLVKTVILIERVPWVSVLLEDGLQDV